MGHSGNIGEGLQGSSQQGLDTQISVTDQTEAGGKATVEGSDRAEPGDTGSFQLLNEQMAQRRPAATDPHRLRSTGLGQVDRSSWAGALTTERSAS